MAVRLAIERSATALTALMAEPVRVEALRVRRWSVSRLTRVLGPPDVRVVGVYLGMLGDLDGHVILLLHTRIARYVAARLLGASGRQGSGDPLIASALGEVGNIAVSSFLSVLADLERIDVRPTPPVVVHDLVGAILDGIIGDLLGEGEAIVAIEIALAWGAQRGRGALLVLPRPTLHTLDRLVAAS